MLFLLNVLFVIGVLGGVVTLYRSVPAIVMWIVDKVKNRWGDSAR